MPDMSQYTLIVTFHLAGMNDKGFILGNMLQMAFKGKLDFKKIRRVVIPRAKEAAKNEYGTTIDSLEYKVLLSVMDKDSVLVGFEEMTIPLKKILKWHE